MDAPRGEQATPRHRSDHETANPPSVRADSPGSRPLPGGAVTTDIDPSGARVGGTRRGVAPGTEFTASGGNRERDRSHGRSRNVSFDRHSWVNFRAPAYLFHEELSRKIDMG